MMIVLGRCTRLGELRRWGRELGILFLVTYLILQVLYFREPKAVLFAFVYFLIFMVPGYFLLEHSGWNILVRLMLSFPIGLSAVVILVYYANILFSIPLVPYFIIWPILLSAGSLLVAWRKSS
jgi:hypothetical protein